MLRLGGSVLALAVLAAAGAAVEAASWDAFTIRNAAPIVEDLDGNGATASIFTSGQKAAYGTSDYDGVSIASLTGISYDRRDIGTGSPYLNIWVSDGTNYAVLAPVVGMNTTGNYTGGEDVRGQDLRTLGFNIYEYSSLNFDWIVPGSKRVLSALLKADNSVITLGDLSHLVINDPNPGIAQGGTGAPKNGTGFNIIFGDTGGNFVSAIPYSIDNVQVTLAAAPVPLPAAALGAAPLLGLLAMKRRRQA